MADFRRILIRATNWIGDAIMSLPALGAVRARFPQAHIAVLARPWVADLYEGEAAVDEVLLYRNTSVRERLRIAHALRKRHFEAAILLQNAFDAALLAWLAGIPQRIGYNRDGRGLLLTRDVPVPQAGEIPRHERFYYLEMLRRAGLIESFPPDAPIRLDGADRLRRRGRDLYAGRGIPMPVVAVSPGAAYGTAKRWLPERFAAAATQLAAKIGASVVCFGSGSERALCAAVSQAIDQQGVRSFNLAGETELRDYIALAAAASLYLTNDSGAMHIASALAVPTVTVFGATDHTTTGPTGHAARIIREPVECSPCLLRECPIDHRCMTAVTVERVVSAGIELLHREGEGQRDMDTRRKIVDVDEALRVAAEESVCVVSGYFDPLTAEHAGRLEEIRREASDGRVVVAIQDLPGSLLDSRSRAEMVAALRTVDYVVAGEGVERVLANVPGDRLIREEDADGERQRRLVEHIRARHEA
ncbi:MAG: lipopolysaccharide heptosyltransferase II [Bryobacteraceae bacterium]|nr:lipopolysaccharide heptosyltransferase II [Bryobacteraceae bacterium]